MSDKKPIQGQPTKSGKTTYLYRNKKGEVVSLLPDSAEKRGYQPIFDDESINDESINDESINDESINDESIDSILSDKPIIQIKKKPLFKSITQLFREFYDSHQNFEIYEGQEKIFDTKSTPKDKLILLKDSIQIFDRNYLYTGLRLKEK
jgi:hypothetical protein